MLIETGSSAIAARYIHKTFKDTHYENKK